MEAADGMAAADGMEGGIMEGDGTVDGVAAFLLTQRPSTSMLLIATRTTPIPTTPIRTDGALLSSAVTIITIIGD